MKRHSARVWPLRPQWSQCFFLLDCRFFLGWSLEMRLASDGGGGSSPFFCDSRSSYSCLQIPMNCWLSVFLLGSSSTSSRDPWRYAWVKLSHDLGNNPVSKCLKNLSDAITFS